MNEYKVLTVPWLLTKSFEKSRFCWKVFRMHIFSVSTTQKVLNVYFFNFFPWDNPMGVLPIGVHPMGKWMTFLMSACLPDSNTGEILKIWQVCNSLPYLHMGLRDLSSTPYNTLSKLWWKSFKSRINQHFFKSWSNYSTKMQKRASKEFS